MRGRCFNKNNKNYKNYGYRGISICNDLVNKNGFANFVKWAMENGYKENLTIDRIDTNGNYSPENCRWVTYKENQNNRRNNRLIQCNGEVKTLSEWAEVCGITQTELKRRLDKLKLPIEIAISYQKVQKISYNGKTMSIQRVAQLNHIDYKVFLCEVIGNGKTAEEVVDRFRLVRAFSA